MVVLVREMDRVGALTPEQQTFRNTLLSNATIGAQGCVEDGLGMVDSSEALRRWAIAIGKRAMSRLDREPGSVTGRLLNDLFAAPGSLDGRVRFLNAAERVPLKQFIDYGSKWLDLLEGTFDPLPPLASGKFHANGEIERDVCEPPDALTSRPYT